MAQASVSAAGLGFSNGRIPTSFLMSVGDGQYMEPHSGRQLLAALADMSAHGYSIPITEGYRSYDTQVQLRNAYLNGNGNVAAVPGTSNHGDGRAVDLGGPMTSWSSAAQAYWASIEANYGFSSAQGRADNEPWHKVCTTWLDNISNTITSEEDDMSAKAEQQIQAVFDAIFNGGSSMPDWNKSIGDSVSHAAAPVIAMSTNRGQWLVAPGYKHHLSPEEATQVAAAKYRHIDFGGNDAAFDIFVGAHVTPTAK